MHLYVQFVPPVYTLSKGAKLFNCDDQCWREGGRSGGLRAQAKAEDDREAEETEGLCADRGRRWGRTQEGERSGKETRNVSNRKERGLDQEDRKTGKAEPSWAAYDFGHLNQTVLRARAQGLSSAHLSLQSQGPPSGSRRLSPVPCIPSSYSRELFPLPSGAHLTSSELSSQWPHPRSLPWLQSSLLQPKQWRVQMAQRTLVIWLMILMSVSQMMSFLWAEALTYFIL